MKPAEGQRVTAVAIGEQSDIEVEQSSWRWQPDGCREPDTSADIRASERRLGIAYIGMHPEN
jgi:hypothetical protein